MPTAPAGIIAAMNRIRFTKKGLDEINKKIESLKNLRPLAVKDLKKAREMGDLSENGYYKAARARLSEIDRSLRNYNIQLKKAVLIQTTEKNIVGIGSKVMLSSGNKFEIVGDLEANPKENKISLLSPLGLALGGRKVGDNINVQTQKGKLTYTIIKISN